jgi:hypothetical protein
LAASALVSAPVSGRSASRPGDATLSTQCGEARPDGTVADARQAAMLSALARRLRWNDGYGPPTACHREVRLFCGPDLDGDGSAEAIVRVQWRTLLNGRTCATIRDGNDYWITGKAFLVSGRAGAWRAVAPLGIDGGDEPTRQLSAWFVRRRSGEVVLRVAWSNVASDTNCEIGGYTVFRMRRGRLQKLEEGDDSPPCPGE